MTSKTTPIHPRDNAPALVATTRGSCSACGGKLPVTHCEQLVDDDGIPRCPHCYRCLSLADLLGSQRSPVG